MIDLDKARAAMADQAAVHHGCVLVDLAWLNAALSEIAQARLHPSTPVLRMAPAPSK